MTKIPSARDVAQSGLLRYIELYNAVQGEGLRIGNPATFLRFAGCTVGCNWCDTKYSWKAAQGTLITPQELAALLQPLTAEQHWNLVVTGGEPLEQPEEELSVFFRLLKSYINHLTIETSGVISPEPFARHMKYDVLWSVSPKLSSANANYPFPDLLPFLYLVMGSTNTVQLKFVIDVAQGREQLTEVLDHLADHQRARPYLFSKMHIILQPVTPQQKQPIEGLRNELLGKLAELNDLAYSMKLFDKMPNLQILPQLHALSYGLKRGI